MQTDRAPYQMLFSALNAEKYGQELKILPALHGGYGNAPVKFTATLLTYVLPVLF